LTPLLQKLLPGEWLNDDVIDAIVALERREEIIERMKEVTGRKRGPETETGVIFAQSLSPSQRTARLSPGAAPVNDLPNGTASNALQSTKTTVPEDTKLDRAKSETSPLPAPDGSPTPVENRKDARSEGNEPDITILPSSGCETLPPIGNELSTPESGRATATHIEMQPAETGSTSATKPSPIRDGSPPVKNASSEGSLTNATTLPSAEASLNSGCGTASPLAGDELSMPELVRATVEHPAIGKIFTHRSLHLA
jgi:hypothetical protein